MRSKCSFTPCKLRFFAHFRLAGGHNPNFCIRLYASRFDAMDAGIDARCNYATEEIGSISPVIVKLNGSRRIRVFDFAHAESR
uniref:Uncharacterized protein n=1 Tax=Candidatus Kentrum sp. DK TaxID=2126562 RepID=A0A450T5I1_9GAMM|nr:MAG: hypothetical protein BECKDK2373B_GA0170837_110518 [Candidatus Kentron sp. DK]